MRNTFLLVLGLSVINFPIVAVTLEVMGLDPDAAFVRAYWDTIGMIFGAAAMWFFTHVREPHR